MEKSYISNNSIIIKTCSFYIPCFSLSFIFPFNIFSVMFFSFFYVNRRNVRFRINFWLQVFDGFTCFGMSWTRFDYFWKMTVCLCVWQKFCGKCSSKTVPQNFTMFYILCYPNINWILSIFGENRSIGGSVVLLFPKILGYADLDF